MSRLFSNILYDYKSKNKKELFRNNSHYRVLIAAVLACTDEGDSDSSMLLIFESIWKKRRCFIRINQYKLDES